MLMIRLRRIGKRKKPTYRIIVSEKQKDTHSSYLEDLGSVNPHTKPKTIELKTERIQHWISVGAQASPTVHNMLVDRGVVKGKKIQAWKPKRKPVKEGEAVTTPAAPAAPAETPKTEAAS